MVFKRYSQQKLSFHTEALYINVEIQIWLDIKFCNALLTKAKILPNAH